MYFEGILENIYCFKILGCWGWGWGWGIERKSQLINVLPALSVLLCSWYRIQTFVSVYSLNHRLIFAGCYLDTASLHYRCAARQLMYLKQN